MKSKDKDRLRYLAYRQAELAHSPKMDALKKDWEAHGRFDSGSRPMMTVELGSFENDILPARMECEEAEARKVEKLLLGNLVNHTLFEDDSIVRDHIPVYYDTYFKPFGLQVEVQQTDGLGHQFVHKLNDLREDFHLLGPSDYGFDRESLDCSIEYYHSIFGDILPAKPRMSGKYFCPTQDIVHLMGMENMYVSMLDYPELFHEMMEQLCGDFLRYMQLLEKEKLLLPTYGDAHLAQGTYCFNNTLPDTGEGLQMKDVWFYMDSQESAGISPDMYAEFIACHYKNVSDRFGLLSYGCCEAVDPFWEKSLSKLRNLRKVSISPWCNEEFMGERLRGKPVVFLRKPFPNDLGVGENLDEDAVREHITKTVAAAQGCTLEFACRDVYSVNQNPDKVKRYIAIMRECCEQHRK